MSATVERSDEQALKFYTACFDGNLEEVQRIVKETPNLELNRVIHGGTAFAAAVQNSHLDVRSPASEARSRRVAQRSRRRRVAGKVGRASRAGGARPASRVDVVRV